MLERMLVDTSTQIAWGHWTGSGKKIKLQVELCDLNPECVASGYEREYFEDTQTQFSNLAVEQLGND